MALTQQEKDDAIALLDPTQTPDGNGKYQQVAAHTDGPHTICTHVYDGPMGAGYVRLVSRQDGNGDTWTYHHHTGPESSRPSDEWIEE